MRMLGWGLLLVAAGLLAVALPGGWLSSSGWLAAAAGAVLTAVPLAVGPVRRRRFYR